MKSIKKTEKHNKRSFKMKKYSSIISIALLFAFVSTSDAQKLGSAKGSKSDSGMKNVIECLSKVRLSSSDYYLVKKAGSGEKLSGKEENQLANLAAKHCGKSEKSGKSSKGKLSSGRTAEMKGAKGAAGKGDARAAKGSKDGKLGKSGRTAEMKGAKGAAGKGDARAAKGSKDEKLSKDDN